MVEAATYDELGAEARNEAAGLVARLEAAFEMCLRRHDYPSPGMLAGRMGLSPGHNFNGACSRRRIELLIEAGYTKRSNGRWGKAV